MSFRRAFWDLIIGLILACIFGLVPFLLIGDALGQQKATVSGTVTTSVSAQMNGVATILNDPPIVITNGIVDASLGRKFRQFVEGPTTVQITNAAEGWSGVLYLENPWLHPITFPTPFKIKGAPYSPTNDYPVAVFDYPQVGKLIMAIE